MGRDTKVSSIASTTKRCERKPCQVLGILQKPRSSWNKSRETLMYHKAVRAARIHRYHVHKASTQLPQPRIAIAVVRALHTTSSRSDTRYMASQSHAPTSRWTFIRPIIDSEPTGHSSVVLASMGFERKLPRCSDDDHRSEHSLWRRCRVFGMV